MNPPLGVWNVFIDEGNDVCGYSLIPKQLNKGVADYSTRLWITQDAGQVPEDV